MQGTLIIIRIIKTGFSFLRQHDGMECISLKILYTFLLVHELDQI